MSILAPLTDNPNSPDEDGETPILLAARYGNREIIKVLAPLTNNPNAPNRDGESPILLAAFNDYVYRYCWNLIPFDKQSQFSG